MPGVGWWPMMHAFITQQNATIASRGIPRLYTSNHRHAAGAGERAECHAIRSILCSDWYLLYYSAIIPAGPASYPKQERACWVSMVHQRSLPSKATASSPIPSTFFFLVSSRLGSLSSFFLFLSISVSFILSPKDP